MRYAISISWLKELLKRKFLELRINFNRHERLEISFLNSSLLLCWIWQYLRKTKQQKANLFPPTQHVLESPLWFCSMLCCVPQIDLQCYSLTFSQDKGGLNNSHCKGNRATANASVTLLFWFSDNLRFSDWRLSAQKATPFPEVGFEGKDLNQNQTCSHQRAMK